MWQDERMSFFLLLLFPHKREKGKEKKMQREQQNADADTLSLLSSVTTEQPGGQTCWKPIIQNIHKTKLFLVMPSRKLLACPTQKGQFCNNNPPAAAQQQQQRQQQQNNNGNNNQQKKITKNKPAVFVFFVTPFSFFFPQPQRVSSICCRSSASSLSATLRSQRFCRLCCAGRSLDIAVDAAAEALRLC